jgi:geranylgeranyl pyrophosphate synthase
MANERVSDMLVGYRRAINERVFQWVGAEHPRGFYDMMHYHLETVDSNQASTLSRPGAASVAQACSLLCFLTYQAVAGQPGSGRGSADEAIGAAAAIELLSGWFQIHRDIEEEIPAARDRPTLLTRWGYAQAINTGDAMFPLAARAMLAAIDDRTVALTLTRELTDIALSHMEGRYHELAFHDHRPGRPEPSAETPEARLEVIELTTGALMGYSAWSGAVIAGASAGTQDKLRRFGANLGIACGLREEHMVPRTQIEAEEANPQRAVHDSPLPETTVSRYLDAALAALDQVAINPTGRQQLATFARECIT